MVANRRFRGRAIAATLVVAVLAIGNIQVASAATSPGNPSGPESIDAPSRSKGGDLFGENALRGSSQQDASQSQAQDPAAETGAVAGTVYEISGFGVENVEVGAFLATGDPTQPVTLVETVMTDAEGDYSFPALPVGDYDLMFLPSTPDYAWRWLNGGPSPSTQPMVQVVAGETQAVPGISLDLSFPVSGSVSGGLSGTPVEGVTVTLWASSGDASGWWFYAVDEALTAADGTYAFSQVPPGYYTFEYTSPNSTYKGEWWNNKSSFESSNVFWTGGRSSYHASSNLQERVSVGTVAITGTPATAAKLTASHTKTSGVKYQYTWLANGAVIPGATASTFVPTVAQEHKTITVRVRGMRTGMISTTRESAPTAKVLRTDVPKITGETVIRAYQTLQSTWEGGTLTAWPGTWTSGATLTYQWYRNGVAIPGAQLKKYTLTPADRYTVIQVRVTGSKDGYGTRTRNSVQTPRIPTIGAFRPTGAAASITLTPIGVFTPGSTFTYYFYGNGKLLQAGPSNVLLKTGGMRAWVGVSITARVLVRAPGYVDRWVPAL